MTSSSSQGSRGKPATRRTLLSRRDALSVAYREQASTAIAARAESLLAARAANGSVVALYHAKGSEVDTRMLDAAARRLGYVVVYPRVVEHTRELALYRAQIDELVPSRFGLREPRPDGDRVAIEDVAAFVVPGVAFDAHGGRIGWGLGHYDATLAKARGALRVGLAFACQIVDELPREGHDELLHVIVTEGATYVAGNGG